MACAENTSEINSLFDLKDLQELITFVRKHGLPGLYKEIKTRLDVWKNVPLDIGVIGASGVGKSTFINTLRRLKPTDHGGATTSVVEETRAPTPYEHPQNPNVKIWDLPGLGTLSFPKKSYLELIDFKKYDFFIIVCSQRFKEDDLWFAKKVRKAKKHFYFVRTKIDDDVRNDHEDYPDHHTPERVLKKVRDDCTNQLLQGNFKDPLVFLVCKNPMLYDFAALEARLIADRQELKHESFVLTMQSVSQDVIAQKTAQLQKRSWLAAAGCVLISSKPVKKLSIIVNIERVSEELKFYMQVYGLDPEGIKKLSESAKTPSEVLTNAIRHHFWFEVTEEAIVNEMERSSAKKAPEQTPYLKQLDLPVIGFILNCPASFEATKQFLRCTIDNMEQAAITVLNTAFSNASIKDW